MPFVDNGPILAIETSCDECAIAIVDGSRKIHAHHIMSQHALHQPYGGVVPEIAARDHLQHITPLVKKTMQDASFAWQDLRAIAATTGPGLAGGLMVGTAFAKALSMAIDKDFFPINHLEGHVLTIRLTHGLDFPYLVLLVSGGHCQFLAVESLGHYHLYGETRDDAVGEAFDKAAFLLGLDYPGGPAIEACAKNGQAEYFPLPVPLAGKPGCDLSFSGLKTSLYHHVHALKNESGNLSARDQANLAASFQKAASDALINRSQAAMQQFRNDFPKKPPSLVLCGGVAANQYLREKINIHCQSENFNFLVPPINLCTDNAAMIAWAACEYHTHTKPQHSKALKAPINPRWPLENLRQNTVFFHQADV